MTPIEMHYSWIGFVYQATAWLGQRLAEKWFDVVLVALGTLVRLLVSETTSRTFCF